MAYLKKKIAMKEEKSHKDNLQKSCENHIKDKSSHKTIFDNYLMSALSEVLSLV